MSDPIFDTTMEQRLQSAMLDYLDKQRLFMVQWNQAQDVLTTINFLAIIGLSATVFALAVKVHRLEGVQHECHT